MKKRSSKDIFADALLTLARSEAMERITVKQIVEASGLSLQTFYNHFHDKGELVAWMLRQTNLRSRVMLETKKCSFRDLILNCVCFYADNANYLRSSFGGGLVNHYAALSADNACAFLSEYICKEHNMEKLPDELGFYLRMYVCACLHIFADWSLKGWEIPAEQLADWLETGMPEKLKPYLLN